ncbi:DotU family type IV/VI secretion system protein [Trinickia sp. LjRoot230]|uniref:DotU/TssL family secretion system protein n=1 Tax=Trinickia sp. LjRoot230 TaxID=3342288 RepID=UPI003ED13DD8
MTLTTSLSINALPVAFRDTALMVAELGWHKAHLSFETMRQRCHEQVDRLRADLKASGQANDVIQDAVYAQCALLDEAALSYLEPHDREAWEREPLQVSEFGSHDAGEALITRMRLRLHQSEAEPMLLAIFHAVLALGFEGRFALEGQNVRALMIQALGERLGVPDAPKNGMVLPPGVQRRWFAHLSLPVCTLLAIVTAGALWALLDQWLGALVGRAV